MKSRSQALDALRGVSIMGMIFASSIAFGILPAWMYHAQEPPPSHIFDPNLPGISWVDLVFPFFLFSLGAAIPLALKKWGELPKETGTKKVIGIAFRRLALLYFFSVIVYYGNEHIMKGVPQVKEHLMSIGCFLLLHLFLSNKLCINPLWKKIIKWFSFFLLLLFLFASPFTQQPFSLDNKDIIIFVLSNVVFFATIIWWFTQKSPLTRIICVAFIGAFFLGSTSGQSWNEYLLTHMPLQWLINLKSLKYLFIVIPGTFIGEWMCEQLSIKEVKQKENYPVLYTNLIGISSFLIIITNIICLFSRHLLWNLIITASLLLIMIYCAVKVKDQFLPKFMNLLRMAACLLIFGLLIEGFEGGIKKDPATFSYLFVCSSLAIFTLIFFYWMEKVNMVGYKILKLFSIIGRNPMVAYVCGGLVLNPILRLTGLMTVFDRLGEQVFTGFLRGVFYTSIVILIAAVFSKKQWFWKT